MSDSNDSGIDPRVVGWAIGLGGVAIGTVVVGLPLQSRLADAGASTLVARLGLLFGALLGAVLVVVGVWLLGRRSDTGPDDGAPRPSELFEDDRGPGPSEAADRDGDDPDDGADRGRRR